jgi:SAM-dependent methyltransferase
LIDGIQQTALVPRIEKWKPLEQGYLLEVALLLKPRTRNALVIGLGAALAPRVLEEHSVECECVEVDPAVVELARRPFGFSGSVTVDDGRRFLQNTEMQWDMIFVDVCTSDRLPWHMFTNEALKIFRKQLSPDGILVIQFIGDRGKWSGSVFRTAEEVFDSVLVLSDSRDGDEARPCWLFAAAEIENEELLLKELYRKGATGVVVTTVDDPQSGEILRDDHFPAESAWARTALRWRHQCAGVF